MFGERKNTAEQTTMLLLEDGEQLVSRIGYNDKIPTNPVRQVNGSVSYTKKHGLLNLTTVRLALSVDGVICDEAFDGHGIPLKNIRMVFPLKKDQVRVHYIGYHPKYNIPIRYQKIYKLTNNDAVQVCSQISDAIIQHTKNTTSDNKRLFLFESEKINKQTEATARKLDGIFYVTNMGLYFEDRREGLGFEMPYTMYKSAELYTSTIDVKYNEMHNDGTIHVHEFQVRPDNNSKAIFDEIKTQYNSSTASNTHDFESLEKTFGEMDGAALRQIMYGKNKDAPKVYPEMAWGTQTIGICDYPGYNLQKYIGALADKKWGDTTRPDVKWCFCSGHFKKDTLYGKSGWDLPKWHLNGVNRKEILENPEKFYTQYDEEGWHLHADFHFRMYEMMLIKAALFSDVSLDVIGEHSEEYLSMIESYQKDFDYHRESEMELFSWNKKLEEFQKQIDSGISKEQYVEITKSSDYIECLEQCEKYQKIRSEYTNKNNSGSKWDGKVEFDFNSYHFDQKYRDITLKEFHSMLRKIYDEWKKNIPLQEFTDDTDYSWINYCLEHVPYTTKEMAFFGNAKDDMIAELARSDGVKKSLSSFRVPENIPKDDIFSSDCWFDKEKNTWFSRCDLPEKVKSVATISRDDSARKYGVYAWGFEESLIKMIHGIPAVSIPYDVFPGEKVPEESRYTLLSYVNEDQITAEMESDRTRTVSHVENAPYTHTFSQRGLSDDESLKENVTKAFEKYKKTKIIDDTSYPPYYVHCNVLEYITVEPRIELSNDGCRNMSTPAEKKYDESRCSLEYSYMEANYPDKLLPLFERVRKHMFGIITFCDTIIHKEDFDDVQKEYDLLFGVSQKEINVLPTVPV